MDGTTGALNEKLDQLLQQTAEVSVAADRASGTIVGIPHYSVIETSDHELGKRLGRRIQARHRGRVTARAPRLSSGKTMPEFAATEIGASF
jgi:hypothetical protein